MLYIKHPLVEWMDVQSLWNAPPTPAICPLILRSQPRCHTQENFPEAPPG